MNDCIFCKIIAGQIPCEIIYEDDNVFAFLDINGKTVGHTLVIPKKHCVNIFDCDDNELKHIMLAVKKIANHYKTFGCTGFNLQVNNGKSAGQEVAHLHFHIMPKGLENESTLHQLSNKLKLTK